MKRVQLDPAYLLHRRAYRETSFLLEIFSQSYGRVSLLARGARKERSPLQGLLQPFVPLLVSWAGKGELMTLVQAEVNKEAVRLEKECLFAGFYLNELLMILLHKWDAHPILFTIYENAIVNLQKPALLQKTLRQFEKKLLEELGYGLLPKTNPDKILPDTYYQFTTDKGFIVSSEINFQNQTNIFLGKNLIAIANEEWQEDSLYDAKRLTRLVLTPLLGSKKIYSRKLFRVG